MRLHTYTVQVTCFVNLLAEVVDGSYLTVIVLVEVVVEQLAVRGSILSCILECILHIAVITINRIIRRIASEIAVAYIKCFVNNVICIKLQSRIILLDHSECILDEVFHTLIHYLLGNLCAIVAEVLFEEPAWSLAVPDKSMTSYRDIILNCIVKDSL